MAQLISVRLNKSSQEPLGFRLQGGKDFGTPLVVQKVNGGSAAERAGLQAGDALIRVNATDVYTLRHQDAQDTIRAAGQALELTVQRGGGTWRPTVTPTGSLPRPGSRPLAGTPTPVTNTSLKATSQPSRAFGSGHNNVAKPFGYMNGSDSVKSIVNKQYNTPVNMYSDKTIAETLSAQTEVLATGALGVNFKKNEKTYDAEKSAVFKVLQEEQSDPEPVAHDVSGHGHGHGHGQGPAAPAPVSGLRSVQAPVTRPDAPLNNTGGLPVGQNICEECERLITGVFVRIKDKNLHVECFKCSTCGSSLKNQGYYNLNGKLYCDIHAKLVARQNPPAPNLDPVTVPPGGRIPTNTYSTPLPPLATNNYSNGSSLFSPNSNLSGPKPFGSSIGSAYSPSLSPRSAPMSPARPVAAPAPAAYTPSAAYNPSAAYAPPAPAAYTAPAPAPAAPFAPTNEITTTSSPHKQEFKSPAEERLIRKMAKMALNGYEIGIQRKIKPADHIQSMADKIQDTVVTKHPLNSDNLSSEENSRENTLRRAPKTNIDRVYKAPDPSIVSIGDKIKETIMINHPANTSIKNVPMPPPIPSSPIPTFNAHSTPITQPLNTTLPKKPSDYIPKNLNSSFMSLNNGDKSHSGSGYSSSEDSNKDKSEGYYSDTLRKKVGFEKKTFLNGMNNSNNDTMPESKFNNTYSNTLTKKKMFEKDSTNRINNADNGIKLGDKSNSNTLDGKASHKTNNFEKSLVYEPAKNIKSTHEDQSKNNELPNILCDNSLYTYKSANPEHNGDNLKNVDIETTENKQTILGKDSEDNAESETVVRRRQKKCIRNDDGRRDSHIIARPLSTMTSGTAGDMADGLYPPICHKCDKAITRGPFITALGRIWCPEHFICVNATCRRPLQDIGFVEENGQLYCEYCFEQYIAPACDKCHAKIKGDCLNAIGKHFHPECFSCVYCGKLFGNNPFFLEDGLPYCESDWNELFTTKCFSCGFPVEAGDRWVEALNNNYHSQCFNCTVCKKNLEGQSFFAKGGRPFCKTHAR